MLVPPPGTFIGRVSTSAAKGLSTGGSDFSAAFASFASFAAFAFRVALATPASSSSFVFGFSARLSASVRAMPKSIRVAPAVCSTMFEARVASRFACAFPPSRC
jgi:hypothetical protein